MIIKLLGVELFCMNTKVGWKKFSISKNKTKNKYRTIFINQVVSNTANPYQSLFYLN